MSTDTGLHYTQRTDMTTNHINQAFSYVSSHKSEKNNWANNGKEKYKLCGADDHALLKKLVDSHPEQSVFKVLDVCAGNFAWSKSIAQMFNQYYPAKTIIVYGVNGEICRNKEFQIGNNIVKNFCKFKVEEIEQEFLVKKSIDLSNQLDLIVASQVMIHLIDPLGTFVQLMNFLKPGGILLSNSFTFNLIDQNNEPIYEYFGSQAEKNIGFRTYHALFEAQAKFLICPDSQYLDNLNIHAPDIMVKKTEEISFPYHYSSDVNLEFCSSEQENIKTFKTNGIEGRVPFLLARFCNVIQTNQEQEFELNKESCGNLQTLKRKYIGDKDLFDLVHENNFSGEIDHLGNYVSNVYCESFA